MSESTYVTEEEQATILKSFRERYEISSGDEVVWIDTEDGILIKNRSRNSARGCSFPTRRPRRCVKKS